MVTHIDNVVNVIYPENFRCIKSGPSECGKTVLLKDLFTKSIYFDKLYIIGPTGDQYECVICYNRKEEIDFI